MKDFQEPTRVVRSALFSTWKVVTSALVLALSSSQLHAQLINETFTTSPAANFTVVAGGTWAVTGGKYVLTNPLTGGSGLNNLSVHNTTATGDWTLTVDASTTGTTSVWNDFGIIFGYQNSTNYYFFSSNESNDAGTSGVLKVASGVVTQLADITTAIASGTTYACKIVKTGSTYQVYRNNVLLATATDSTWAGGKVGFGTLSDGATFDNLIVTYGQVAAPAFNPGGGTYASAQSVTISSATSGATIRYTTDGSTPSQANGTIYSTPVSLGSTTTLKAIAYKAGWTDSSVTSATYTINIGASASATAPGTAGTTFVNSAMASQNGTFTATFTATPSASPMDGLVALSLGSQTIFTGMATIARFNPSGSIDARNGGAYAAASTIPYSAGQAYAFRMVVNVPAHTYSLFVTPPGGSELTVGANYAFRSEQSTVGSLDNWAVAATNPPGGASLAVTGFGISGAAQAVAAPAFSPGGGTYSSAQSVAITSATSGATIRYTTNGSTPSQTNGTVYSGPVTISATTTLKAIAYKSGMLDSAITIANYTINSGGPVIPNWNDGTWNKLDLSSSANGLNTRTNFDFSFLNSLDALGTAKFVFYRSNNTVDTRSTIHIANGNYVALAFVGLERRTVNPVNLVTALIEVEPDICDEIWFVGCLLDRQNYCPGTSDPDNKSDAIQMSGGGGDVYVVQCALVNVNGAKDTPHQHGDCFQHYGNGVADPSINKLTFYNVRMTGRYQGFGSFDYTMHHTRFTNVSYKSNGPSADGGTSGYGYWWSTGAQNDIVLVNVWHHPQSGTVSTRNWPNGNPYGIKQDGVDGTMPTFAPDSQVGVNYVHGIQ